MVEKVSPEIAELFERLAGLKSDALKQAADCVGAEGRAYQKGKAHGIDAAILLLRDAVESQEHRA